MRAESRTRTSASSDRLRHRVEPARRAVGERVAQHVGGLGEVVGLHAADVPGRPLRARSTWTGVSSSVAAWVTREASSWASSITTDVVLRDHRHALDRVDREQRVVGDDQLRPGRALLGALGEALLAERAPRGAQALPVGDRHLPPDGLVEGWKSVNTDPSNFSAHRFLADSYSVLPRHEIARVSELLQSQLLQPLNMTPIQPRLAESNLFLISAGGPGALSFNEFNPIFNRDGVTFQTSGLAGENSTYSGEGVLLRNL